MKTSLKLIHLLAVTCIVVGAQLAYHVSGTVVGADGKPVPNSMVAALHISPQSSAGSFGYTPTNDRGEFQFALPPGEYTIIAKAEEQGYGDPTALLNRVTDTKFPRINVRSDMEGISVQLGRKGGVVEGTLVDKNTGRPIKGDISFSDASDPSAIATVYSNLEGRFRFTLPPKAVKVSAAATGYQRTALRDAFVLVDGEHRSVTIEMTPLRP